MRSEWSPWTSQTHLRASNFCRRKTFNILSTTNSSLIGKILFNFFLIIKSWKVFCSKQFCSLFPDPTRIGLNGTSHLHPPSLFRYSRLHLSILRQVMNGRPFMKECALRTLDEWGRRLLAGFDLEAKFAFWEERLSTLLPLVRGFPKPETKQKKF